MASRQTRSASIPIPANPARNIESVIAIPFSTNPATRPRLVSSGSTRAAVASSPERAITGRMAAPVSPVRTLSGGYAAALNRGPPTQSTITTMFEPRVIRATGSPGHITESPVCVPISVPHTRRTSVPRVPSVSTTSIPPSVLRSTIPLPTAQTASVAPQFPPFQRPAYLEQSSLRDLLYTDAPPLRPSNPLTSELAHHGQASWASTPPPAPYPYLRREQSPSGDTDEDSTASPSPPSTRGTPAPAPSTLLTHPVLRLPTRWNEQDRHPSLTVSSDGRELTFFGPSCIGERDSAAARANNPIPPACGIYYYEVEIVQKPGGNKGHISIGFASPEVRLSRLPGWEKHSWGYHADDGCAFDGHHKDGQTYGPTFDTGDVIGCGIDFSQNRVFYTKNGAFLGMVFDNVGKGVDIYPSIGLRQSTESIRVNFGHSPFKYAIDDHVHAQRNNVWANIQSTQIDWDLLNGKGASADDEEKTVTPKVSIPKGGALEEERMKAPVRQLVLSYLAHHGYAKTARAFQAQCDDSNSRASGSGEHAMDTDRRMSSLDAEFDLRTRIDVINSVLKGDVDTAIALTREHHPVVLEREQGLMLFKLRCRKFVELILDASDALKRVQAEQAATEEQERWDVKEREREAYEEQDGMDGLGAMDVDDPSPEELVDATVSPALSTHTSSTVTGDNTHRYSPHRSITPSLAAKEALHTAIEYGQKLEADYKTDGRPDVRSHLKRTFGVVAYADPIAAGGEVAEMAGQEARARLANELNQAILESQGKPAHPALETLYRQTAAVVVQLGLLGVGQAAFADMSKEFLDA
ncbi:hypothetical protein BDY19DRAFT_992708 [Irpex rosettiformis]|uniref:Uncharacterized protein n=1 Tax=Irpex rosettiformis TaxID=378272 RepID=A0ACB8U5S3_9APHY|nr:hypothetical protein BDY19DRAFT_992708 [Irpex rosettiformis]